MATKSSFGLAAMVFLSFLFILISPVPKALSAEKAPAETDSVEYTIEEIRGSHVQVLEAGETKWEAAVEGQVVEAGDTVKVGAGSEASLSLGSETSVHLAEKSEMRVGKVSANETGGFFSRLQVMAGRLFADVKKNLQDSHSSFEVESNGVVCGVRGTAFEVVAEGEDAQVATHEGKVEVTADGKPHMVAAGNYSAFKKGKFQLLRRLDRMELQRFQRWRTLRQVIRQKRIQRVMAIRNHARQPWMRKHPRIEGHKPLLKRDAEKNREMMKKKLRKGAH